MEIIENKHLTLNHLSVILQIPKKKDLKKFLIPKIENLESCE